MAPIAKQRPTTTTKQKPRFSQTRLTTTLSSSSSSSNNPKPKPKPVTPTRTPFSVAAGSAGRTKAKPNQSILNFFQKAPRPEEGLFIDGPAADADPDVDADGEQNGEGTAEAADGTLQQDVNGEETRQEEEESSRAVVSRPLPGVAKTDEPGDDDDDDDDDEMRFNERGGSVKRRRLDPAVVENGADDGDGGKEASDSSTPTAPAAAKRRAGNPFLDDSDSDSDANSDSGSDDDCEGDTTEGKDANKKNNHQPGIAAMRTLPLLGDNNRDRNDGDNACGDVGNVFHSNGDSDDFTADELRIMREMEEQVRMELEGNGEDDDDNAAGCEREGLGADDDNIDDDEGMVECCPICGGSFAGTTPDRATAHVNACLDGNPTPLLPKPPDSTEEREASAAAEAAAAAAAKRSARAAIPRPGQANPIRLGDTAAEGPSAFARLMSGHAEDTAWATAAAAEAASKGLPAYKRTCPFYKIMPGFSICVDAFRYGAVEGCKAYFLSHFHSDHYVGLSASWTHGPIYCSKVTAALVKSQLKTADKYVVELEFEKTVPIPGTDATVTMIPANHCPGSSLFLFEKTLNGRLQRILHCGDFRACPAHVEHPKLRPELLDAVTGRARQQKIDVCYLDTTYLNPRYSFPPQSDVVNACAELCKLLNDGLLAGDDTEWKALLRRPRGGGPQTNRDVSKFFLSASASASSTKQQPPSPAPPPHPPAPAAAAAADHNNKPNAFAALNGRPHNPNRLLVVCGTYSIGKERLCLAVAKALGTRIYAAPAKLRMCRQLDDPELTALLTSDPAEAQVHMQSLMEIGPDTLAEYLAGYKAKGWFGKVVGFKPSGWNYRPAGAGAAAAAGLGLGSGGGGNGNGSGGSGGSSSSSSIGANLAPSALPTTQLLHGPLWRPRFTRRDLVPQRGGGGGGNGGGNGKKPAGNPAGDVLCFSVPYSEHSSFRELALFLMALRIERVVPTVNVGSEASRKRMKGWIDRWVGERRKGGLVRVGREAAGDEGARGARGRGEPRRAVEREGWEGRGGALVKILGNIEPLGTWRGDWLGWSCCLACHDVSSELKETQKLMTAPWGLLCGRDGRELSDEKDTRYPRSINPLRGTLE
ncbi:hypothetical protein VTJ83DRAFT_5989 [Remersonia thermophila]|uniref:DNA repair metallo-beta-lactamase domain-containing protein n=1 Tax=Remersonia thermophila TaxID=72144 RepID=A0ABR4D8P3_9PEZI